MNLDATGALSRFIRRQGDTDGLAGWGAGENVEPTVVLRTLDLAVDNGSLGEMDPTTMRADPVGGPVPGVQAVQRQATSLNPHGGDPVDWQFIGAANVIPIAFVGGHRIERSNFAFLSLAG